MIQSLEKFSTQGGGVYSILLPSLLTLMEYLLGSSSELRLVIVSEFSPGRCCYHTFSTDKVKAWEKVCCPRVHQEKVTGLLWNVYLLCLFGFVKCLCLSLQYRITEMWRMHIQGKLQYTLRVQGKVCLIRPREARGDFLKNTKSREEENVDCLG